MLTGKRRIWLPLPSHTNLCWNATKHVQMSRFLSRSSTEQISRFSDYFCKLILAFRERAIVVSDNQGEIKWETKFGTLLHVYLCFVFGFRTLSRDRKQHGRQEEGFPLCPSPFQNAFRRRVWGLRFLLFGKRSFNFAGFAGFPVLSTYFSTLDVNLLFNLLKFNSVTFQLTYVQLTVQLLSWQCQLTFQLSMLLQFARAGFTRCYLNFQLSPVNPNQTFFWVKHGEGGSPWPYHATSLFFWSLLVLVVLSLVEGSELL